MTVLLVEDNAEVAALFSMALWEAGHPTEIAGTGESALARLLDRMCPVKLLLVDLDLPGICGAEVVLRAREAGVVVPAIAVSGAMSLIDPDRLHAAGFVAALEKPVQISELLNLVRTHLP